GHINERRLRQVPVWVGWPHAEGNRAPHSGKEGGFGCLGELAGSALGVAAEFLLISRQFYYLRARYYDPATGRFSSQDPIPDGNLYAYGRNNPVNFTDASGLSEVGPTGVLLCAGQFDPRCEAGGGGGGGVLVLVRYPPGEGPTC